MSEVSFIWPSLLWLLPLLLVLPLAYWWLLGRRRTFTVHFSSVAILRQATPGTHWRRYVPPLLLWLALALLLLACARPSAEVALPWARSTILLAMDVSRSMRVQDVQPTRMVAAQEAAKAFLAQAPMGIEIGLVTFAGTALVAQQATLDRAALVKAIDAIQMQYGTAIGSGIVLSLAELFPTHGLDLGEMTYGAGAGRRSSNRDKLEPNANANLIGGKAQRAKPSAEQFTPVAPGSFEAGAIILLSDGRRTTGIDTLQAAKMAADRGVRIYVIGLGTPEGHMAAGGGEWAMYLQLDEPTLREVARITGGEYHHAATAEVLRKIYENLGSQLQIQKRETELTALVAALAALLVATAAGLSVWWFGRVV